VPTVVHPELPIVTQAVAAAGILVRNVRSGVLDELRRDYMQTARGKGLHRVRLMIVHVLPKALPVTVSMLATVWSATSWAGVLSSKGFFGWPGLGPLLFDAVTSRNFAVVQGVAPLAVVTYTPVNLASDLARSALDPRTRV
jgi:peptide/nickel transport system permease protein